MYFVCRWREESPFGKRVVTVPDATALDWFRRGWDRDDAYDWIGRELGGDVYGLNSIFEEARERNLPRPETVDELRELLNEHLWVEGDDEGTFIRLGEHALRVRTDDDEVDLAYYFIDNEAAASSPDRLTYLLHDTWPLPTSAAAPDTVFSHDVPVRTVQRARPEPDSVFSVHLPWDSPDMDRNLDLAGAIVFPGLTLTDLAAHLRGVDEPDAQRWPRDARLLRALIAPGENTIGPALERYARLSGYAPSTTAIDHIPAHDAVHREMRRLLLPQPPSESRIRLDRHIGQVARYVDSFLGYDQWFLFDTRWAAAHPNLARSLLRYAAHWDPYGP
ncbi:hypothetical protein [Micromonospora sp. NBC_01796]|uniref:hypothetical protein n=1 Tax=Micromonospora sp. NBC_01796 TaxID=2975987 RepID=UPI002DDAE350|nr:hypothetical protein [Micromonospora sp. NBC_01796]WSA83900.1 hypothetical protein OIE47_26500 [Micromonospora sp. NBC_01796]